MSSISRIIPVVPALLLVPATLVPSAHAASAPPPEAQKSTCNGQPATIVGTAGDDQLVGTPGRDVIQGLGGDDTIRGMRGNDVLCGGAGRDRLAGGAGTDYVNGQQDADVVRGGAGDDRMVDRLNERAWDGEGWSGPRNRFVDGPGSDRIRGKSENPGGDLLSYDESARGVTLSWQQGTVRVGRSTDRFQGMARIIGSEYADLLTGRDNPRLTDEMAGGDGNDELRGQRGPDRLTAGDAQRNNDDAPHAPPGPGHDTVHGGPGNDVLLPGGNSVNFAGDARSWSFGGRGNDTVVAGPAGGRAFGQAGSDELYLHAHVALRADLRTGDVTGLPLRSGGFERHDFDIRDEGGTRIIGSPARDAVRVGSPKPLRVTGGAGNDTIDASNSGSDGMGSVSGGDGDDDLECRQPCNVNGGPDDDVLHQWPQPEAGGLQGTTRGGLGDDSLTGANGAAHGGPGSDHVASSGSGAPTPLVGGPGADILAFETYATVAGVSRADGGQGDDTVSFQSYRAPQDSPGASIDLTEGSVSAGEGTAQLVGIENATGSRFDDTLIGDDADNVLHGGDGTDTADGRGGTDTCTAETVTNCEG